MSWKAAQESDDADETWDREVFSKTPSAISATVVRSVSRKAAMADRTCGGRRWLHSLQRVESGSTSGPTRDRRYRRCSDGLRSPMSVLVQRARSRRRPIQRYAGLA